LLQGAQHGLPVGAGAHPKQAEMVDRQFQIEAGLGGADWT
jgi:hypothetical protein